MRETSAPPRRPSAARHAITDGTPRRGPSGVRAATSAVPRTTPEKARRAACLRPNAGARLAPVWSVVATRFAPATMRKRSTGVCVFSESGTGPRSAACIRASLRGRRSGGYGAGVAREERDRLLLGPVGGRETVRADPAGVPAGLRDEEADGGRGRRAGGGDRLRRHERVVERREAQR